MPSGGTAEVAVGEGAKAAGEAAAAGAAAEGGAVAAGSVAADAAVGGIAAGDLAAGGITATAAGGAVDAGITGAIGAGMTGAQIVGGLKTAATILSPVSSIIQTAAGMSSARARLGAATPIVPATTPMPIAYGSGTFAAQQNSLSAQALRRGRAATVLTSPAGEKLG